MKEHRSPATSCGYRFGMLALACWFLSGTRTLAADDPAKLRIVTPMESENTVTVLSSVPRAAVANLQAAISIVVEEPTKTDDGNSIYATGTCCDNSDNTSTTPGKVKFTLDKRLAAGQIVTVTLKPDNTDPITASATVGNSVYDWGRAQAYFSLGTVLAKSRNEFSSPSLYLGLNVDYTWRQSKFLHSGVETCPSKNKDDSGGVWCLKKGAYLNTFFESRLTQVATVSAQGLPNLQLTPNSILQSQQSGYVSGGVYAPFIVERWMSRGNPNGLFLGPLAELGFQTVNQGSIDGLSSADAALAQIDSRDVYKFLAGGLRIGHVRIPRKENSSPRLISYLDLTAGRWDNLRLARPDVTPVGGAGYRYPVRFQAEGKFQLPRLPLFVGFAANIGSGPDDLRFVFGTRFNAADFLSYLSPRH